jgi:hypothetical protein
MLSLLPKTAAAKKLDRNRFIGYNDSMQTVQFAEEDDLIDICYDNVFKAVFTKGTSESRGALNKLLEALLGR